MAYLDRPSINALFQTGDIITETNMAQIANNLCLCSEYDALSNQVGTNTSDIAGLKSQAPIPGPTGPAGPQGPAGQGVNIAGVVDDISDLPTTGNAGDLYFVGNELYTWDDTNSTWKDVGALQVDLTSVNSSIDTINSTISTIQSDISTNQSDIATNKSNIATNVTNISTNASAISTIQGQITNINATQTNFVSDLQINTQKITQAQTDITTNATNIATNSTSISNLQTSLNNHLANLSQYRFSMQYMLGNSANDSASTPQFVCNGTGPTQVVIASSGSYYRAYTLTGSTITVTMPNGTSKTFPGQIIVPTATDGIRQIWTAPENVTLYDITTTFEPWDMVGNSQVLYPFTAIATIVTLPPNGGGNTVYQLVPNSFAFATSPTSWSEGAPLTTALPINASGVSLNRGDRFLVVSGWMSSNTTGATQYIYHSGNITFQYTQSS